MGAGGSPGPGPAAGRGGAATARQRGKAAAQRRGGGASTCLCMAAAAAGTLGAIVCCANLLSGVAITRPDAAARYGSSGAGSRAYAHRPHVSGAVVLAADLNDPGQLAQAVNAMRLWRLYPPCSEGDKHELPVDIVVHSAAALTTSEDAASGFSDLRQVWDGLPREARACVRSFRHVPMALPKVFSDEGARACATFYGSFDMLGGHTHMLRLGSAVLPIRSGWVAKAHALMLDNAGCERGIYEGALGLCSNGGRRGSGGGGGDGMVDADGAGAHSGAEAGAGAAGDAANNGHHGGASPQSVDSHFMSGNGMFCMADGRLHDVLKNKAHAPWLSADSPGSSDHGAHKTYAGCIGGNSRKMGYEYAMGRFLSEPANKTAPGPPRPLVNSKAPIVESGCSSGYDPLIQQVLFPHAFFLGMPYYDVVAALTQLERLLAINPGDDATRVASYGAKKPAPSMPAGAVAQPTKELPSAQDSILFGAERESSDREPPKFSFLSHAQKLNMCKHPLVDDASLTGALRELDPSLFDAAQTRKDMGLPHDGTYFIAMLLHNNEDILANVMTELFKVLFMLALAPSDFSNLFVSIYESGSSDFTRILLSEVQAHLRLLGVPHSVVTGDMTRKYGEDRIMFLSHLRNQALAPLFSTGGSYEKVLFLNDVIFCSSHILELAYQHAHHGADMACAVDVVFDGAGENLYYYDVWVAIDMEGQHFQNVYPFIKHAESLQAFEGMRPFQVFSCWGGAVVLPSSVFMQERLRFRHGGYLECPSSECELFARDLWSIGRGKVVTIPTVVTAYEVSVYNRATQLLDDDFDISDRIGARPVTKVSFALTPPRTIACWPLDSPFESLVAPAISTMHPWQWWYTLFGTPSAISATHIDARLPSLASASEITLSQVQAVVPGDPDCSALENRLIPREVIFTWITDVLVELPIYFFNNMLMWMHLHPCHSFTILSDGMIDIMVKETFPHYAHAFYGIRDHGMRADLSRYLYLSLRGGLYADTDTAPVVSTEGLIASDDKFVIALESDFVSADDANRLVYARQMGVSLHCFATIPGSPVLEAVIERVLENIKDPATRVYPEVRKRTAGTVNHLVTIHTTGPGPISDVVFSKQFASDVSVHGITTLSGSLNQDVQPFMKKRENPERTFVQHFNWGSWMAPAFGASFFDHLTQTGVLSDGAVFLGPSSPFVLAGKDVNLVWQSPAVQGLGPTQLDKTYLQLRSSKKMPAGFGKGCFELRTGEGPDIIASARGEDLLWSVCWPMESELDVTYLLLNERGALQIWSAEDNTCALKKTAGQRNLLWTSDPARSSDKESSLGYLGSYKLVLTEGGRIAVYREHSPSVWTSYPGISLRCPEEKVIATVRTGNNVFKEMCEICGNTEGCIAFSTLRNGGTNQYSIELCSAPLEYYRSDRLDIIQSGMLYGPEIAAGFSRHLQKRGTCPEHEKLGMGSASTLEDAEQACRELEDCFSVEYATVHASEAQRQYWLCRTINVPASYSSAGWVVSEKVPTDRVSQQLKNKSSMKRKHRELLLEEARKTAAVRCAMENHMSSYCHTNTPGSADEMARLLQRMRRACSMQPQYYLARRSYDEHAADISKSEESIRGSFSIGSTSDLSLRGGSHSANGGSSSNLGDRLASGDSKKPAPSMPAGAVAQPTKELPSAQDSILFGAERESSDREPPKFSFLSHAQKLNMCKHPLVDDASLTGALRELDPSLFDAAQTRKDMGLPHDGTYFIAMLLHNNEDILANVMTELFKVLFMLALAPSDFSNLFVSIYESGSSDFTRILLSEVQAHLRLLGVPHSVVTGDMTRKYGEDRIMFLSHLRNQALAPLFSTGGSYEKVLFLNDVIFCSSHILELAYQHAHHGADMACAVDVVFDGAGENLYYYDVWVAIDMEGQHFQNVYPFIKHAESLQAFEGMRPFQVFSCWGGAVVLPSSVFMQERLRFRHGGYLECPSSECELFARDLWSIGRGKVVTIPTVVTAYEVSVYNRATQLLDDDFDISDRIGARPVTKVSFALTPPRTIACWPLDSPFESLVAPAISTMHPWQWWYTLFGTPSAISATHIDARLPSLASASEITLSQVQAVVPGDPDCSALENRLIPREVIFTWITDVLVELPIYFFNNMLMWMHLHPCHSFTILSDGMIDIMVKETFPHYAHAFYGIRDHGMRADLSRYLYLSLRGGLYADTDTAPVVSTEGLIASDDKFVIALESDFVSADDANRLVYARQMGVSLHCFATIPGSPVLEAVIERVLENIKDPATRVYPEVRKRTAGTVNHLVTIHTTGPGPISDVVFSKQFASDVSVHGITTLSGSLNQDVQPFMKKRENPERTFVQHFNWGSWMAPAFGASFFDHLTQTGVLSDGAVFLGPSSPFVLAGKDVNLVWQSPAVQGLGPTQLDKTYLQLRSSKKMPAGFGKGCFELRTGEGPDIIASARGEDLLWSVCWPMESELDVTYLLLNERGALQIWSAEDNTCALKKTAGQRNLLWTSDPARSSDKESSLGYLGSYKLVLTEGGRIAVYREHSPSVWTSYPGISLRCPEEKVIATVRTGNNVFKEMCEICGNTEGCIAFSTLRNGGTNQYSIELCSAPLEYYRSDRLDIIQSGMLYGPEIAAGFSRHLQKRGTCPEHEKLGMGSASTLEDAEQACRELEDCFSVEYATVHASEAQRQYWLCRTINVPASYSSAGWVVSEKVPTDRVSQQLKNKSSMKRKHRELLLEEARKTAAVRCAMENHMSSYCHTNTPGSADEMARLLQRMRRACSMQPQYYLARRSYDEQHQAAALVADHVSVPTDDVRTASDVISLTAVGGIVLLGGFACVAIRLIRAHMHDSTQLLFQTRRAKKRPTHMV